MDQARALDGQGLREVVGLFRDLLKTYRDQINRLNVFPVPDGDTGTNMALTMDSVAAATEALDPAASLSEICATVAHASLMGAHGNSGVILSQLLRGIAEVFGAEPGAIGADSLARALRRAADSARQAVQRPAEGTILSVADGAADAIAGLGRATLGDAVAAAEEGARQALSRTPRQLEVLARAGVVDAGGAGLVLLYDALHAVVAASPPHGLDPASVGSRGEGDLDRSEADSDAVQRQDFGDLAGLRYEVMFLLEAPDAAIPDFRQAWARVGDSIAVVGGDGLWNCHVHTDDIGAALEASLDVGRPRQIRVTDLLEQVEEERWVRASSPSATPAPSLDGALAAHAVVAVTTGEGLGHIFASLGASRVILGSEGGSPSVAELLEAIEAVPAESVLVLPNHKNVAPVAEQAAKLSTKSVAVVPTREVPEGIAAACEFDPGSDLEENLSQMAMAAGRVTSASVSRAARAVPGPDGPIEVGDWVGVSGGQVLAVGASASEIVCALVTELSTPRNDLVTLVEGEGDWTAETQAVTGWMAVNAPGLGLDVHQGGQPIYAYLIGIE